MPENDCTVVVVHVETCCGKVHVHLPTCPPEPPPGPPPEPPPEPPPVSAPK